MSPTVIESPSLIAFSNSVHRRSTIILAAAVSKFDLLLIDWPFAL